MSAAGVITTRDRLRSGLEAVKARTLTCLDSVRLIRVSVSQCFGGSVWKRVPKHGLKLSFSQCSRTKLALDFLKFPRMDRNHM